MYFLDSIPGRTCFINGKEFLFFSGYSYLGMNHVKQFRELLKDGVEKYGSLFPSSRISNTRFAIYDEFESSLSQITGMEETVSFSSGYLAAKTISEVLSSCKNIYSAPGTHPSLEPGVGSWEPGVGSRDLEGRNFNEWKKQLTTLINSSEEKEFVLIADSVNVMTSEVNDPHLKIDDGKKVIFLIDDSHGIGLLNDGKGIRGQIKNYDNIEYIICYSLSKALNIPGGAVSCSKEWAKKLREHPNYSGSTPVSPVFIHAFLNSTAFYSEQRKKLKENIIMMEKQKCPFLHNKSGLPVFICSDDNADTKLYLNNIIISSFSYPFPDSPKINRVVINSLHTAEDIEKIAGTMSDA